MSGRQVKLVFISDFACPWCYIGLRELQLAIQQATNLGFQFDIEIRPFMLNNSCIPPECTDKNAYLKKKMGVERWEACKAAVAAKGEECGINFAIGGPLSSTLLAHRLVAKALEIGGTDAQLKLVLPIFRAYHEDELDIGKAEVLADIADDIDLMSREEALEFLRSNELTEKVQAQVHEAKSKGVTGVPFTVIDSKWAVSGGQKAAVFVQIFNKMAQACDGGLTSCTPKVNGGGLADKVCQDPIPA